MKLWKVEFVDRWSQPELEPTAEKRVVHVVAKTLKEVEKIVVSRNVHLANGYNRYNEIFQVTLVDEMPPYSSEPIYYEFN